MFLPLDKVYIKSLEVSGTVLQVMLSSLSTEFYVRYYLDKKQEHSWFLEQELSNG